MALIVIFPCLFPCNRDDARYLYVIGCGWFLAGAGNRGKAAEGATMTTEHDKRSEQQARYKLESIAEMVRALRKASDGEEVTIDGDGPYDEDGVRERIEESVLSVQVRSGWVNPGTEKFKAEEFELLLCTGGPAVRIVGELDEYGQPTEARIQHQDWGTPWTDYPATMPGDDDDEDDLLMEYCRVFYFGE